MIFYQGITNSGKVYSLCFSNEQGVKISVPIDEATGHRISLYLTSFDNKAPTVVVERDVEEVVEE